jgi:hypothetical protein
MPDQATAIPFQARSRSTATEWRELLEKSFGAWDERDAGIVGSARPGALRFRLVYSVISTDAKGEGQTSTAVIIIYARPRAVLRAVAGATGIGPVAPARREPASRQPLLSIRLAISL